MLNCLTSWLCWLGERTGDGHNGLSHQVRGKLEDWNVFICDRISVMGLSVSHFDVSSDIIVLYHEFYQKYQNFQMNQHLSNSDESIIDLWLSYSQLGASGNDGSQSKEEEEDLVLPMCKDKPAQKKKILIQEIKGGNSNRKENVKKDNSFAKNLQMAFSERNKISKDVSTENTDGIKLRSEKTEVLLTEITTRRYWTIIPSF